MRRVTQDDGVEIISNLSRQPAHHMFKWYRLCAPEVCEGGREGRREKRGSTNRDRCMVLWGGGGGEGGSQRMGEGEGSIVHHPKLVHL